MATFILVGSKLNNGVVTVGQGQMPVGTTYQRNNDNAAVFADMGTMDGRLDYRYKTPPEWDIPHALVASSGDFASAFGAAATVTYAPLPNQAHVIEGIAVSYNGNTNNSGYVSIVDGTSTVFGEFIAGPSQFFPFDPPKRGQLGLVFSVNLAGVPGLSGTVSILGHRTE